MYNLFTIKLIVTKNTNRHITLLQSYKKKISLAAKISSFSGFGENYRYLSYKYGIGIHVWHLTLWNLYNALICTC